MRPFGARCCPLRVRPWPSLRRPQVHLGVPSRAYKVLTNAEQEKLKPLRKASEGRFRLLYKISRGHDLHPDTNPLDSFRLDLAKELSERITKTPLHQIDRIIRHAITHVKGVDQSDIDVLVPGLRLINEGFGTEDLNLKMINAFRDSDIFEKPVTNTAKLNFRIKPAVLLPRVLSQIQKERDEYGRNQHHGLRDPSDRSDSPPGASPRDPTKKRIIVEFSSPNIAKPFHAGHLRSTIIGAFLANLYEGAGWDVIRMNYLGDWGKQYGLLALAYEMYGDAEALEKDPIQHLFQLYVRISAESKEEQDPIDKALKKVARTPGEKKVTRAPEEAAQLRAKSLDEKAREYFVKMTARDPEAIAQWQRFRDLSIATYQETYKRLGIRFDVYSGESQVSEEKMEALIARMKDDGVVGPNPTTKDATGLSINFKESGFPDGKKLGHAVIQRRDGTFLYITRDIVELLERKKKYDFDEAIYVVSSEQDQHLRQLFALAGRYGGEPGEEEAFTKEINETCKHINFGLVQGMSTRRGTVVFLNEILDEARDRMLAEMKAHPDTFSNITDPEATADILGMSAVMVADLTGKRRNNYKFDIDAMTRLTGATGPSLQYAHARICSIRRRVLVTDEEMLDANWQLLAEEPLAVDLVRLLAQYPDVIQQVLKTLEPTNLLAYLFRVTTAVGRVYPVVRVEGAEREEMVVRMAMYDCARQVLANGMRLLGLTPLERM